MSFGDGNLHVKNDELKERIHRTERLLADANGENNRLKGEMSTLREANERLLDVNGALCAEVNAKAARIRELELLACDLYVCMGDASCRRCSMENYCKGGYGEFAERMAALGIEVG